MQTINRDCIDGVVVATHACRNVRTELTTRCIWSAGRHTRCLMHFVRWKDTHAQVCGCGAPARTGRHTVYGSTLPLARAPSSPAGSNRVPVVDSSCSICEYQPCIYHPSACWPARLAGRTRTDCMMHCPSAGNCRSDRRTETPLHTARGSRASSTPTCTCHAAGACI